MSKERQIKEMAEVLRHSCENGCFKNEDGFIDCEACEACLLYDAGYRKQREGEWIKKTKKTTSSVKGNEVEYHVYFCSKCGYEIGSISYHHKFCQNCGARMKNAGWRDDV